MIADSLISYWNYGRTYCGLELSSKDGELQILGVIARRKQGEFQDLNFLQAGNLQDIKSKLPKRQHVHLAINTDKVLIKRSEYGHNPEQALSQSFPGLDTADFYYQVIQSGSHGWISVCRKETVDGILNDFEKEGIHVVGFSLGFGAVHGLLPLLNQSTVQTSRQQLEVVDNRVLSQHLELENTYSYRIDDISVSSSHLLSVGALVGYESPLDSTSNAVEQNNFLSSTYVQKNFFRKAIPSALAILLIILLVNFLFFNHYYRRHQQLQQQSELVQVQTQQNEQLKKELGKKAQQVYHLMHSGYSKSSYYINRLVASKPPTVSLSALSYQPLSRNVRANKAIEYQQKQLEVSGVSVDKGAFSNWTHNLEGLPWIESVLVADYHRNAENEDVFELKISLKDEADYEK